MKALFLPVILIIGILLTLSSCKKDENHIHFSEYPQQFATGGEIEATSGVQLKSNGYVVAGTSTAYGENGWFFEPDICQQLWWNGP